MIYSRPFPAAQLTEEAIWLFGNPAVDALSKTRSPQLTSAPLRSTAFPDGGLYVLADSDPYPQAIVVDAGPQGVGRSGHGHADALSLRLVMDGRRWLVTPGAASTFRKIPPTATIFAAPRAQHTARRRGRPGRCR